MLKIIASIFFIGTAIIIFFSWTQPLVNDIKDLRAEKTRLDAALSRLNELQSLRKELLEKYNSISDSDLSALNKILPSKPNPVKMAVEISELAKSRNLSLKSIDVQQSGRITQKSLSAFQDRISALPLVLRLSGPYKSFIAFLEDLEKSLLLIEPESIKFSSGAVDSYEYGVSGIIYYYSNNNQQQ